MLLGMPHGEIVCNGGQLGGIGSCQRRARASLATGVIVVAGILVGSETQPRGFQGIVVSWREGLQGGSQRPGIVGSSDGGERIVDGNRRGVEELCCHGRDALGGGGIAREGMSDRGEATPSAEVVRSRGLEIREAGDGRRRHGEEGRIR